MPTEIVLKQQEFEKRYCTLLFVVTGDAKMASEGTFEPCEHDPAVQRSLSIC